MNQQSLALLERHLWPRGERGDIWMILDCARDPAAYSLYLESSTDKECLYSGNLAPELRLAAPYLLRLDFEERYARRFLKNSLGRSWGIILKCDNNLKAIRKHLRQFLVVRDYSGRKLVFRYYDPRVLRTYLPTCTPAELREVYGPIESFWAEGEEPNSLLEFRFDGRQLQTRDLNWNGQ